MERRENLTLRWAEANHRADVAVAAIAKLMSGGITDSTAGLLADFKAQLDSANADLDHLEWEAGQNLDTP